MAASCVAAAGGGRSGSISGTCRGLQDASSVSVLSGLVCALESLSGTPGKSRRRTHSTATGAAEPGLDLCHPVLGGRGGCMSVAF